MFWRTFVLLLLIPTLGFSYTVIRKDGKRFDGTLVQESENEVLIKDRDGVTLRFKKGQIDWEKTVAERTSEEKTGVRPKERTIEIKSVQKSPKWSGDPISIDFKDIDIRDLFRVLAETGKMNLIVDPTVKGTVTLKMTEVPWDQVLDVVCRMYGLGYTIDGNVVSIGR